MTEVDGLPDFVNLLDLFGFQLPGSLVQFGKALDSFWVSTRSHNDDLLCFRPETKDCIRIDRVAVPFGNVRGDLVQNRLQGPTRVTQEGSESPVACGNNAMLFVDLEDGLEVNESIWMNFELLS